LIELALAKGGKDNITITLISFKKTINKNIEKQNSREHKTPLKREKKENGVIYLSNIIKYIITIIILIIVIIWATGKLNSSFNAKELFPFDKIQKRK
jgi:hypothetical protein